MRAKVGRIAHCPAVSAFASAARNSDVRAAGSVICWQAIHTARSAASRSSPGAVLHRRFTSASASAGVAMISSARNACRRVSGFADSAALQKGGHEHGRPSRECTADDNRLPIRIPFQQGQQRLIRSGGRHQPAASRKAASRIAGSSARAASTTNVGTSSAVPDAMSAVSAAVCTEASASWSDFKAATRTAGSQRSFRLVRAAILPAVGRLGIAAAIALSSSGFFSCITQSAATACFHGCSAANPARIRASDSAGLAAISPRNAAARTRSESDACERFADRNGRRVLSLLAQRFHRIQFGIDHR